MLETMRPGPRRVLSPTSPKKPGAGCTNEFVLNHKSPGVFHFFGISYRSDLIWTARQASMRNRQTQCLKTATLSDGHVGVLPPAKYGALPSRRSLEPGQSVDYADGKYLRNTVALVCLTDCIGILNTANISLVRPGIGCGQIKIISCMML